MIRCLLTGRSCATDDAVGVVEASIDETNTNTACNRLFVRKGMRSDLVQQPLANLGNGRHGVALQKHAETVIIYARGKVRIPQLMGDDCTELGDQVIETAYTIPLLQ